MAEEDKRVGRRIKVVLMGNRYYSGTILSEDADTITFKDIYDNDVTISKSGILSLEVLN